MKELNIKLINLMVGFETGLYNIDKALIILDKLLDEYVHENGIFDSIDLQSLKDLREKIIINIRRMQLLNEIELRYRELFSVNKMYYLN